MRRSIGLLIPALFVLVAVDSHAATITNTYQVEVSGVQVREKTCNTAVPAPVDAVKLAFSISFDNSANITDSTANITLIYLNMPNDGPLIYTYQATGDVLFVGDAPHAQETLTGHNYFSLLISNISTSPTVSELFYTVSSPAVDSHCEFLSGTGTVIVGPPWEHLSFAMTGVRLGQTIRLNVVAGPVRVPGPGPCEALLNIYDAANNLVASRSVSPPGSVSFDYGLRRAAVAGIGRFAGRQELRPEVILMPGSPAAGAAGVCQEQATVEVYDDLVKSTSVITHGQGNPGPIQLPAAQFGPVGVGFLQTVRLNVTAFPPDPCFGTLSFTDVEGNPIGASSPARLTAGQATFIDLPGTSIVSDSGHGEVMAVFTQPPGVAPGDCLPSVEVYDQLTGGTQVLIPSEVNPGPIQ
jgi:hypothetical protein